MLIRFALLILCPLICFSTCSYAQETPKLPVQIQEIKNSYQKELISIEQKHAKEVAKLELQLLKEKRLAKESLLKRLGEVKNGAMEAKDLNLAVAADSMAKAVAAEENKKSALELQRELEEGKWHIRWMDTEPNVKANVDFSAKYTKDVLVGGSDRRVKFREIVTRPTLSFGGNLFVYDEASESWLGFWASKERDKMRPMKLLKKLDSVR